MKERYGIEYSWVAGCVVSDELIGHAKGYNQIMTAEIHRKFGDDILKKRRMKPGSRRHRRRPESKPRL